MSAVCLGGLATVVLLVGPRAAARSGDARARSLTRAAQAGYDRAAASAATEPPSAPAALQITHVSRARPAAPRDLDCLATAVYYEARGESADGQAAVAQVVLNRTSQPAFPKSVCRVVYQGCQFSFACNGAMRGPRESEAWRRARTVAGRALDGYVMAAVGHATSFHAARLGRGRDGHMSRVAQVGGHVFLAVSRHTPSPAVRALSDAPSVGAVVSVGEARATTGASSAVL